MTTPQALAEYAVERCGAPGCVVIVEVSSTVNLRWANSSLTTNGSAEAQTATVIAIDGAKSVSVTGIAHSRTDIDSLLHRAVHSLPHALPAEDVAPLVDGGQSPDWDLEPATTSPVVFSGVTAALAASFNPADHLQFGFVSHDATTTYLATSAGTRRRHLQWTGHYGITARSPDHTASSWIGGATPDFALDFTAVLNELRTRLRWSSTRLALPAGRYNTILPPSAVADLTLDAYWAASARQALDGQSVYGTTEGEIRWGEVFARPGVHLYSDASGGAYPSLRASDVVVESRSSEMGSIYDNGISLSRTDWIRDGRLASLIQTQHTATETVHAVTPAIDNLILEVDSGSGTLEDLVARTDDGLLVTCLWYLREVDPQTLLLTGVTRDCVYQVEGGEVVGVVNNFRFNESPIDLLKRFTAASETVPTFGREWGEDYFSRTAMPALQIPDFNMSSVSEAL